MFLQATCNFWDRNIFHTFSNDKSVTHSIALIYLMFSNEKALSLIVIFDVRRIKEFITQNFNSNLKKIIDASDQFVVYVILFTYFTPSGVSCQ